MKNRIYVGLKDGSRQIFRATSTPTQITHGNVYNAVIGPFVTLRGARFMRVWGMANPHCQTVRDAERLGKEFYKDLL